MVMIDFCLPPIYEVDQSHVLHARAILYWIDNALGYSYLLHSNLILLGIWPSGHADLDTTLIL